MLVSHPGSRPYEWMVGQLGGVLAVEQGLPWVEPVTSLLWHLVVALVGHVYCNGDVAVDYELDMRM